MDISDYESNRSILFLVRVIVNVVVRVLAIVAAAVETEIAIAEGTVFGSFMKRNCFWKRERVTCSDRAVVIVEAIVIVVVRLLRVTAVAVRRLGEAYCWVRCP